MIARILDNKFFDQDAITVAKSLIGKIIYRQLNGVWLKVRIIETEAYYIHEQASHSSLGLTPSRKAMFMPAGTIYMYYSRGRDSLNISVKGEGNAVLIKSGLPYISNSLEIYNKLYNKSYRQSLSSDIHLDENTLAMLELMQMQYFDQYNNQNINTNKAICRPINKLCNGQTLLCQALKLKVPEWNEKNFDTKIFFIKDENIFPKDIIASTRLGIRKGRSDELPYRFIDSEYRRFCTKPIPKNN